MTRPDLFVYIALAAAWVLIAAWVQRIGRLAHHLQARVEEADVDGEKRT